MAPSKKVEKGTKTSKTTNKAIEKPKRERKEKVKKDPDCPKKPQSPYFLWMNATRNQIKDDNPEMKAKEVVTECGKVWKEMTDEDKEPWVDKAKEAKEAYEVAIAEYNSSKGITNGKAKPAPKGRAQQQQQQQVPMSESEEEYSDE